MARVWVWAWEWVRERFRVLLVKGNVRPSVFSPRPRLYSLKQGKDNIISNKVLMANFRICQ